MNQNLILQFLYDLEQNNCREWFHDHKQQYQAANGIFEELVETLMLELKKSDPTVLLTEPGKLTFKLVRDTRFSNDKSPYLPAFRTQWVFLLPVSTRTWKGYTNKILINIYSFKLFQTVWQKLPQKKCTNMYAKNSGDMPKMRIWQYLTYW